MSPVTITPEQRARAIRIYAAALPLIAGAVGLSPKTLHNRVLREALFASLPYPNPAAPDALTNAAGVDDLPSVIDTPSPAETSRVGEGTLSPKGWIEPEETKPVMKTGIRPMAMEPTAALGSTVHLKNKETGAYLHWSGELMTMEKSQRWSGTPKQALAAKRKFDLAASLSMVRVIVAPKL